MGGAWNKKERTCIRSTTGRKKKNNHSFTNFTLFVSTLPVALVRLRAYLKK